MNTSSRQSITTDLADHIRRVDESAAFLRKALQITQETTPTTIIQLGTGLGAIAAGVEDAVTLPYREIPHFPISTVESHSGNLLAGTIGGQRVAILQGRVHYYEGYPARDVAFAIRVLSLLGAENLILTNSAGGLNPLFQPGTIMILRDHLNFLGDNPLRGANNDEWGPRFPDMSTPYDPALARTAFDCAKACGISRIAGGTYACIPGPSLETPAETRWLRDSGADAVGMSSVPEAIVAKHAGMRVLGLSVISNINDPDNFNPILLEDILEASARTGPLLEKLIGEIVQTLP